MAKKSMAQLLQDFRSARNKTEKLQNSLPLIIGVEAVKVVRENFDKQGYDTGVSFTAWPKRAAVTNWSYDYNRVSNSWTIKSGGKGKGQFLTPSGRKSKAKNRYKGSVISSLNPILLQTRTLYRSIAYFLSGKKVTIGVDPSLVIYAQKMNEGGKGRWGRKAATNTPARKFMPTPHEAPNPKILARVKEKVRFEQWNAMAPFRK